MRFFDIDSVELLGFWAFMAGLFLFFLYLVRAICAIAEDDGNNSWLRGVQIFSARLVLEIWGGAGAIWGFSEVITLRNSDTVWFWRPVSLIFGSFFFCRWILQLIDYWSEIKWGRQNNTSTRLYQIFSVKLVLEVFGSSGAVWGFSEALTLRTAYTIWFWRPTAQVFGLIFFLRWIIQMLRFIREDNNNSISNKWFCLLQTYSARLVLEVWGATGAIWGFSEILTIRNTLTVWFWRPVALAVGAIFFYRWLLQIRDIISPMTEVDHPQHLYKEVRAVDNDNFAEQEILEKGETTKLCLNVEHNEESTDYGTSPRGIQMTDQPGNFGIEGT